MTTVKWMDSATSGAPILSGTAGAMIAVLDACLVNGWGSATIDSLVVASGVATVTKSGHPFRPQQISEISGSGSMGGTLNGQRRVLTTTSTTYTFDATGIPDQTATGTISHKVAALGWTKPFADAGNVAVYRLNSADGTGSYLRVNDSGATAARCVGYASMSDLNTGLGDFPTAAQLSGGTYWGKSGVADSSARLWIVTGDDQGFYFHIEPYPAGSDSWRINAYFGDIQSVKQPDPYRAVMAAPQVGVQASANVTIHEISYVSTSAVSLWFCRGVSGIGSAVQGLRSFLNLYGISTSKYSGSGSDSIRFPNPADNGFYVSPLYLSEVGAYRGTLPGFYATPHDLVTGDPLPAGVLVDGVIGAPGRTLRSMSSSQGYFLLDVTGPWR